MTRHVVLRLYTIIFCMIFLLGCKDNYHCFIGTELKTSIKADSDSAAYMYAFTKYLLIKKFYEDQIANGDQSALGKVPEYFKVFDNRNRDITDNVHFTGKELIQNRHVEMMNGASKKDIDQSLTAE